MQPQYQYPPQPEQQPPAYPPQYGPPPAYPPPAAPPQAPQFIAPPAPQYPPQYGQAQYPPAYGQPQGYPPPPPTVRGSLDDFYNQPSTGGGKALSFEMVGTTYVGIVSRPIGDGDIQQQTDTQGKPATFRDGRPKFVMRVPLQMQPSQLYPDGIAQWFVKGNDRDELVRAMAEAGAPEGPPEAGSIITITFTGTRPSGPGMNPTKLKQVRYQRPGGAAPATANGHAAVHQVAPAAAPPPAPERVNGGQPPQYAPPPAAPPPAAAPPAQTYPAPVPAPPPAPPVPQPGPPAPPASAPPPVELDAGQRELLAKLTGQTASVPA